MGNILTVSIWQTGSNKATENGDMLEKLEYLGVRPMLILVDIDKLMSSGDMGLIEKIAA